MGLTENIEELRQRLSPGASVNLVSEEAYKTNLKRWSEFKAPQPGAIVNVATESDIEQTVKWAVHNGVKFVGQAGGHSWTAGSGIGEGDIIINLRGMREVNVDVEAGTVVISAGTLIGEAVSEVHKHKAHLTTGTCDTVGVIGATLGGGFGRLQGKYGLGVDNMISARLVTAQGKCITVSAAENPDLWWGLRGAGHNFGIVSSLKMMIYPQTNGGQHWTSTLIFTPDKIEALVEAINKLDWDQEMAFHFFIAAAPPDFKPAVVLSLWYPGLEEVAKEAYSPLLTLGAVFEHSQMTPYDQINADADPFCEKGGQKRIWSTSIPRLDGSLIKKIWNLYIEFVEKYPQAGKSVVMFECYPVKKVMEVAGRETAYPHRKLPFHGLFIVNYEDPVVEQAGAALGEKFRSLLREKSGLSENHVYVNFATGDEKKEEIYGENLEKLQELKNKWDGNGYFDHFNPIC